MGWRILEFEIEEEGIRLTWSVNAKWFKGKETAELKQTQTMEGLVVVEGR